MKTFLFFSKTLFLTLILNACGSNVVTVNKKDYRIFVYTDSEQVRETIDELTATYNDEIGIEAIKIVDNSLDSNSSIQFISGLRSSEKKIGLGQWVTRTSFDKQNLFPNIHASTPTRVVHYSMKLKFDLENFSKKMTSRDDKSSGPWRHLYHLFCHEVGHGLKLGHDENEINSVMYPSIPENSRQNVDYNTYFNQARAFLDNI